LGPQIQPVQQRLADGLEQFAHQHLHPALGQHGVDLSPAMRPQPDQLRAVPHQLTQLPRRRPAAPDVTWRSASQPPCNPSMHPDRQPQQASGVTPIDDRQGIDQGHLAQRGGPRSSAGNNNKNGVLRFK
jgi:hypothetical protein